MKNQIFTLLGLLLFTHFASAQQLDGTHWATKWGLPINDSIYYSFQNDTLFVTDKNKANIFTSTYTESSDTLRVKDVSGSHACDPNQVGTYTFEINGNTLNITAFQDSCQVREGVLPSRPLKKRTVVGIGDIDYQKDVALFPNPAKENLYINLPAQSTVSKIEVLSITGNSVYSQAIKEDLNINIDCSNWKSGVYFVRFYDNKGVHSRRMVKQ